MSLLFAVLRGGLWYLQPVLMLWLTELRGGHEMSRVHRTG
jgi:hypothetical protein